MYIVPPLWPHILWLYLRRNDSELVLWPVEWRLISGYFSVWSESSQSTWRNQSLGTYREMSRSFSAKCRGVSQQTFAEFLWDISRRKLGEISDFYFSPRKHLFRARGVPRRHAKKELLGRSVRSFVAKQQMTRLSLDKKFGYFFICFENYAT